MKRDDLPPSLNREYECVKVEYNNPEHESQHDYDCIYVNADIHDVYVNSTSYHPFDDAGTYVHKWLPSSRIKMTPLTLQPPEIYDLMRDGFRIVFLPTE